MAITKPIAPRSIDAFIDAAPDAGAASKTHAKRTMKGKQVQFSHTMPPDLLEALDAFVEANKHIVPKRAPAINIAVRQMLKQGILLDLRPTEKDDQS